MPIPASDCRGSDTLAFRRCPFLEETVAEPGTTRSTALNSAFLWRINARDVKQRGNFPERFHLACA